MRVERGRPGGYANGAGAEANRPGEDATDEDAVSSEEKAATIQKLLSQIENAFDITGLRFLIEHINLALKRGWISIDQKITLLNAVRLRSIALLHPQIELFVMQLGGSRNACELSMLLDEARKILLDNHFGSETQQSDLQAAIEKYERITN